MLLRILITAIFFFQVSYSTGQTRFTGTYAGIYFLNNVSGMQRYDISYYFRNDGTYCDGLGKPDWQTRVSGTYSVKGDKVILSYGEGRSRTITILNDGDLFSSPYRLFKLNAVSNVPIISLKYTGARSMGGIGIDMVYTGVVNQDYITFDGKKNFTHSGFGSSVVAGEDVGGGSSEKYKGDGYYTINNGMLKLKYNDGSELAKSFFFRGGKTPMALIDGRIYYEIEKINTNNKMTAENNNVTTTAKSLNGAEILKKSNLVHGGKNLDNIKTMRFQATTGGTEATIFMDVTTQKVRYEIYRSGKLYMIKQLTGNEGWQWADGKIADIPVSEIKKSQRIFITGILGLRSSLLQKIKVQSAQLDQSTGSQVVIVEIDGEKYGWIFDKQNRLMGETNASGGEKKAEISKDFRSTDGVMLPFVIEQNNNGKKFIVAYSNITVNPVLSDKTWQKPQ